MKHKLKKQLCNTAVALLVVTAPAFAAEDATVASGLPGIEIVGEVTSAELAQTGEARLPTGLLGSVGNAIKLVSYAAQAGWGIGTMLSAGNPGPYPGFLRATGLRR